jgi:protein-disulfide isomerase
VALLIANLALQGEPLQDAKIGILCTAVVAVVLTWVLERVTSFLPKLVRARALYGSVNLVVDLSVPVDPERDHIRGPDDAPVTLVEYGDFECPHCGMAEPVVRELLAEFGDLRYVWRHLPLTDVHPRAQLAAEASEAAAAQGRFWEMHDLLFRHQDALTADDLVGYAGELDLDVESFRASLNDRDGAVRVSSDVESADLSTVAGTPTFFINERRHYGAFDIDTLSAAVRVAHIQAKVGQR